MSGPYRAVMICDLNNPKSVQYTQIARHSFRNTKKIEIELWQCFVPETRRTSPYRYVWAGTDSRSKYKNKKREIPQLEKACLESHMYWWMEIAKSNEPIIIMEHDAYCRNTSKFEALIEQIPEHMLWNCGIAAECYTMNDKLAKYLRYKYLVERNPVSSGPMAELFYHVNIFYDKMMGLGQDFPPTLWPTERRYTKKTNQLRSARNPFDCLCKTDMRHVQSAPVTQCFNYDVGNTIQHTLPISRRNNPDVEFLTNEQFGKLLQEFELEQNTPNSTDQV